MALPCAGALVFWLASLVIVGSIDAGMLQILAPDGRGDGAAVQPADAGHYQTVGRLLSLDEPWVAQAYRRSLRVSLATALAGGSMSLVLVYGLTRAGGQSIIRRLLAPSRRGARLLAWTAVAFACPLAFGHSGLIAVVLDRIFGASLVRDGITLGSLGQLILVFSILQIPLLLLSLALVLRDFRPLQLLTAPMSDAPGREQVYGVALSQLIPALLVTTSLLFSNSLGAQIATCAEYGCEYSSLPYLLVDQQRRGDVPANHIFGYALSIRMALTMAFGLVTCAWIHTMNRPGKESLTIFLVAMALKLLRSLRWLLG